MRGHIPIIELRLQRKVPKFVFINDYPCKTDWFEHGDAATVCTAGDTLSSIDLRFLVGLRVSITALSETRAKALFSKAVEAGAVTVGAGVSNPLKHTLDQSQCWSEVYHAVS